MPLFRRSGGRSQPSLQFTVGTQEHRVVVGGTERGLEVLDELRGYVASVTGAAAAPREDGRDSVAVLSAKMDYAEMVNDAVAVVLLATEELVERGVLAEGAVPAAPAPARLPQGIGHYDYIQAAHARAEQRLDWLVAADAVLREQGVGVLRPVGPRGGTRTRPG